jgi:hypothetical protein
MSHREFCLVKALAHANTIETILANGLPGDPSLSLIPQRDLTRMRTIVRNWSLALFVETKKTLEEPEDE